MSEYSMEDLVKAIAVKHGFITADDTVVSATTKAAITKETLTQPEVDVELETLVRVVSPSPELV